MGMLKQSLRRELSDTDKQNYHKAIHCALNKPKTRYPNENLPVNRLDDLTWTHVQLASDIHFVVSHCYTLSGWIRRALLIFFDSSLLG